MKKSREAHDRKANGTCNFTKNLEKRQTAAGGNREQLLAKAVKEIDEDKAHDLHGKVYGGRNGTIIIENRLDGYDDPNCTVRVDRKAPMTVMDVLADMCKSQDTSAFKQWLLPKADRHKTCREGSQVFEVVGGDLPHDRKNATFHLWNKTIVLQRV